MKKDNQESVVLIGYSEDRLKKILHSVFNESLDSFLKDKLKREKDEDEYLTIPASAKILNKSVRTLYNWIGRGVLRTFHIEGSAYIKKSDLLNLPSIKSNK